MKAAVCLFAKAPHPGNVKTRLAQDVGDAAATELAEAFLQDSWENLAGMPGIFPILACAGQLPPHLKFPRDRVWDQGEGDLGQRIERVLRKALCEHPVAIAIGSDSPALPGRLLQRAVEAGQTTDAVLGLAGDGGFYLLGLRDCPEGLLAEIPWSSPHTGAQTLKRLASHLGHVEVLERWWDVDQVEDLPRLQRALERGDINAPRCVLWLSRHGYRLK